MLTKNAIKTYLNTPEGQAMIRLFSSGHDDWVTQVSDIVKQNQDSFSWPVKEVAYWSQCANYSYDFAMEAANLESIDKLEDFKKFIENFVLYAVDINPEDENSYLITPQSVLGNYRYIASIMSLLSLAFWNDFKENGIFYPVLYDHNFADFADICKYACIELPDVPAQKDKLERCLFYYQICEAIEKFRVENDLTQAEVCAILYGYLKSEIRELKEAVKPGEELPAPMRIWWAGAAPDDYETSLNEDVTHWQGNEECQRGDIVVIYARAPYSHIHSVWRAARDCKFEPFDYYCDRIVVTDRVEVPHISLKELKQDARTKDWPVVRKQMQGMNRFEITPEQYNVLLAMFAEKEMDISQLPSFEVPDFNDKPEISVEKDVEERLLIPLLSQLGYSAEDGEDWKRQFKIKLGRNVHGIPDFVFFPKELAYGEAFAPMLFEVKLDFKNTRQFRKDLSQGYSYVRALGSSYLGVCDQNQIRIYKKDAKGWALSDAAPDFQATWAMLKKPEVFNRLKRLIGRDVIAKIKK